jgi:selT/selW/selH-like putative selenoprotein
LAAEIQQELGVETQLIPSDRGAFEVKNEGTLVFSKHQQGRFPEPGEVVRLLRK